MNYFSALANSHFGTTQQGYLLAEGGAWLMPTGIAKAAGIGLDVAKGVVGLVRRGVGFFREARKPLSPEE